MHDRDDENVSGAGNAPQAVSGAGPHNGGRSGALSSRKSNRKPALQVICLGNGGGPSEDNVSGLLVRSIASNWARGSLLAIDAGAHLASIIRILERDFPLVNRMDPTAKSDENGSWHGNGWVDSPGSSEDDTPKHEPTVLTSGPFAGLKFPSLSARANGVHVVHNYVSTYLITHPHLDHLSAFAINTAAFHATSRPKTLAALPSTVEAVKRHIFNDIIWPNLTDEDGGVGFVTFQRLKEGGDVMVGMGEARGYIDVSDRLGVKGFKVSHGTCTKGPPSHQHRGSIHGLHDGILGFGDSTQYMSRNHSQFSAPGTPGATPRPLHYGNQGNNNQSTSGQSIESSCVVDSSAFFIRDEETNREVLVFGDVEPDSISLSPRNHLVWAEAARKIAHGRLGGIFIECSYDDSQADAYLFGHLNPRHLIAELQSLAGMVNEVRSGAMHSGNHGSSSARKRKRSMVPGFEPPQRAHTGFDPHRDRVRSGSIIPRSNFTFDARRGSLPDAAASAAYGHVDPLMQIQDEHIARRLSTSSGGAAANAAAAATAAATTASTTTGTATQIGNGLGIVPERGGPLGHPTTTTANAAPNIPSEPPLTGVQVIIIHVKDTMMDGPHASEIILEQLKDYEQHLRADGQALGCEFLVSQAGESYWF